MKRVFLTAVCVSAAIACSPSREVQDESRRLYARFVPLEPATLPSVSSVEWEIESEGGKLSGAVDVSAGEPVTFTYPGNGAIHSLELRGYGPGNEMVSWGRIEGNVLESGTPEERAPVLFSLIDTFQAYRDTAASARTGHFTYVDPRGRIISFAGGNGISPLRSVDAFDHASGTASALVPLSYARREFGVRVLADQRVLLVGGSGDAGAESSAELWDPATDVATSLQDIFGSFDGALSFPRPKYPQVLEVAPRLIWIIDGEDSGTSSSGEADIVDLDDGVGFVSSATSFATLEGDVVFSRLVNGTSEFEFFRWGGFLDGDQDLFRGRRYRSDSVMVLSTFALPILVLAYPQVLETEDAVVLLGGTATDSYSYACQEILWSPSGSNPAAAIDVDWPEPRCAPAAAVLDSSGRIIVAGGRIGPDATTNVVTFDYPTGTFSAITAPLGGEARLVYPRARATAVRTDDGRIVVVGGQVADDVPLYEVFTPSQIVNGS